MDAGTHRAGSQSALLSGLLRDVSRSFYLTLRVLPGRVRAQIGLAYLLARATDTVADTEIVPPAQRLAALDVLGASIQVSAKGQSAKPPFSGAEAEDLLRGQAKVSERVLLERLPEALEVLRNFEAADREVIGSVLETITSGQALDLQRFGGAAPGKVQALDTGADLDDYTFRVAGCVGEFWTHICRAHLFPQATLEMPQLLADAVRFGKGLQLVNILRDIPSDLRRGRCYLPARELGSLGLRPEDLLEPRREARLRPVYDRWLDRAEQHLEAGWRYTLALPRSCVRVRLACAWPILIGIETCGRLRTEPILDPDTPVKVSRRQVRQIMAETLVRYPVEAWWSRLFERHRHKPGS